MPEPTLTFPKSKALPLIRLTSLLPVLASETAPLKALLCVKVMALLPALKLLVPAIARAPVCVMRPPAIADKLPLIARVGKIIPALSNWRVRLFRLLRLLIFVGKAALVSTLRKATLLILLSVPPKLTAPLKSLACVFKRISEPARVVARVTVPALAACVIAPLSVMGPPAVMESVPLPTEEASKIKAPELTRLTLFTPLLFSETGELKLLVLLLKLRIPALLLKVAEAAPAACVIALPLAWLMPRPLIFKLPEPTVTLPRTKADPLVKSTSLAPLLVRETAPAMLLLRVKLMALFPALKLAVPGTVMTPVCVIAPPAVADREPPFTKVKAVKAMPVLSKATVKLREFVKLAKLVGKVAATSILRKPTSRILPKLPPKVTAPLKSLGWVFRRISELAAVEARVTVPALAACVMAPVSVIEPPEISERVPLPTEEAPSIKAVPLVRLTLLAPLLFKETAEVKLLPALVRVIAPALPVKLAEAALAAWLISVPTA